MDKDFFKKNDYVIRRSFIDPNMCTLLYRYVCLAKARLEYIDLTTQGNFDEQAWGTFNDTQAPGDYSKYGDLIFDTLLELGVPTMKEMTGIDVIPTYSYHRLYTEKTILRRHKDRPSCELSTTLFLGHDISNLKEENYSWPMGIKKKDGEEVEIHLNPGDMIIYRGCEVEHWRKQFKGLKHAQVFLHYNEKDGKYHMPFDTRPMLGLPGACRQERKNEPTRKSIDYGWEPDNDYKTFDIID